MNKMTELQELIDTQAALLGITSNQREVWLENGELKPGSNKQTEAGLHLLDLEYRLNLAIEDLHNDSAGLLVLLVHQFAWPLQQEDLEGVSYSVAPNDNETVDVEFSLGVREPVYVVPVDNSPIEFNGQKWGFGDSSFAIAEVFAGVSAQSKP